MPLPTTVTVALPSFPPAQVTSVLSVMSAMGPPTLVTVALALSTHPLKSVTVTVYVPAVRLKAIKVVCPLDHK